MDGRPQPDYRVGKSQDEERYAEDVALDLVEYRRPVILVS
jgi:hypothetical protein